jgi:SSS family solute:Na+ symporter
MIAGTAMVAVSHFKSPIYALHLGDLTISAYAGVFAVALNLVVSAVLTPVCDALGMKRLDDTTVSEDYDETWRNAA